MPSPVTVVPALSSTAPPQFSIIFDPRYAALVGTHRVQRVPDTEKSGRRHSSVVTVVMLNQSATSLTINPADVRTDTYRSSGAGGQHRNKVSSSVRLTHMPTGTVVTATEERSQHQNRKVAWARLHEALSGAHSAAEHASLNEQRTVDDARAFTWTSWRDEVKSSDGRKTAMSAALSGRLDKLMEG